MRYTNPFESTPLEDPEEDRKLKEAMFEVFFGNGAERAEHRLPFYELPPDALELLPPDLRMEYDAELAASLDPRSGRTVHPYTEIEDNKL
jgi:hypothetical protein